MFHQLKFVNAMMDSLMTVLIWLAVNVTIHARLAINPQTLVVVHVRLPIIEIIFSPMEIIFVHAKMVILRI